MLCHRKLSLNIEMPDFKTQDNRSSLGVLSIELAVHGFKNSINYLEKEIVSTFLTKSEESRALKIVRFYNYSTGWWQQYRSLHPTFEKRAVKIFAKSCSI